MLNNTISVQCYELTRPFSSLVNASQLEQLLRAFQAAPASEQEFTRSGWSAPDSESKLVYTLPQSRGILLCLKTQKKVIPSGERNRRVNIKKAALIAELEGEGKPGKLSKKKSDQIIESVTLEMLKTAFSNYKKTLLYINESRVWVVGNTSDAEKALALLRKSIGSLPVTMPIFIRGWEKNARNWLCSNDLPEYITPSENFVLTKPDSKKKKLTGNELGMLGNAENFENIVYQHNPLKVGFFMEQLGTFRLEDRLSISSLKATEAIDQSYADTNRDEHADRFEADAILAMAVFEKIHATFTPWMLEVDRNAPEE